MAFVCNNDDVIFYEIVRKGTKNLYARIGENNIIRLSVPYFVSKKTIEAFVIESYYKLMKRKSKKKSIVNNEEIKVLGESYNINEIDNIEFLLINKLKEYLKKEYLEIVSMMGIDSAPKVILKKVKGYLGQYNKNKHQITLNILIGHLSKDCVRYVIVHELSHIRYMNHSKDFWNHIEKYLPSYKELRRQCKKEFIYYENY